MTTPVPRPWALLVAAALLVLQAVAAAVYGVLEAAAVQANRLVLGVGTALILLGYGVVLAVVARGVARARRWSRGLAVVTQLISLLLGWSLRPAPTTLAGLVLALAALATLVCLLLPASTAAFVGDDGR